METSMLQPGIFNTPRPKRPLLPNPNKKRKTEHKVEEISFDNDARADYLTGFHKRKVERAKRAKAEAEKKMREERVVVRKQLREERKQELEEHVNAVNAILKEVSSVGAGLDSDEEGEVWGGIQEEPVEMELLDREEEYVDEDRWTTVTVEAVDISKEGLKKVREEDDEEEVPELVVEKQDWKEEKKKWPKKEKKKFRYESKAERKFTRGKQKAGNKARADARKGNS
ncbi:hypothetical protein L207DRAFT_500385 [Hyaloscypha variabilis F]|uniref:Ribosomal RNA-processing protein 17 n=1 Tax=Hyaloscypha variabilis (strain UAMH 11265 / GT02V1 / F) TaxID=1149755 RepID=A0A2J6R0J4_HYAVF|nr:hypothetical protein L207DRAFT_500385 [Hyaloscypha variabilis F]